MYKIVNGCVERVFLFGPLPREVLRKTQHGSVEYVRLGPTLKKDPRKRGNVYIKG